MSNPVERIPVSTQPKLLYSPEEAAELLSISRTRLYSLLGRTVIQSVKKGRQRLIPALALERYVQRRMLEQCHIGVSLVQSGVAATDSEG